MKRLENRYFLFLFLITSTVTFAFLWASHMQPASPLLGWIFDITEEKHLCQSTLAAWGSKNLLFNSAHILNFKVSLRAI